jgi:hypothetical protein
MPGMKVRTLLRLIGAKIVRREQEIPDEEPLLSSLLSVDERTAVFVVAFNMPVPVLAWRDCKTM